MILKSNFHTHTTFCDGKSTAEEMVQRALELGFDRLGFSGHCYTWFDPEFHMDTEAILPSFTVCRRHIGEE